MKTGSKNNSIVKRIMRILFLSCLKATELIEKKLHFSLSRKERYRLKMHKMMCNACRQYEKHTFFIDHNLKHSKYITPNEVDVEQLKKLINEKLSN
jgi:hypothetical protein